MVNKIYNNLRKDDLLAELKMQLFAPSNTKKTFIVFEGLDDITLLKSCFTDNCILFESYSGKIGVEDIIDTFDYPQVIGIIDRDYAHTLKKRLFLCDYCNAEMMVISNDDAFTCLMEKLHLFNNDPIDFRNSVLNSLLYLSALRKANDEYHWNINFSRLPIIKLLENQTKILYDDLIQLINRQNVDNPINHERELLIQAESIKIASNLLMYTNGHDFCTAFIHLIKRKYPNNKVTKSLGEDNIHTMLYIGFRPVDFIKTNLFNEILNYQTENALNILSFVSYNNKNIII